MDRSITQDQQTGAATHVGPAHQHEQHQHQHQQQDPRKLEPQLQPQQQQPYQRQDPRKLHQQRPHKQQQQQKSHLRDPRKQRHQQRHHSSDFPVHQHQHQQQQDPRNQQQQPQTQQQKQPQTQQQQQPQDPRKQLQQRQDPRKQDLRRQNYQHNNNNNMNNSDDSVSTTSSASGDGYHNNNNNNNNDNNNNNNNTFRPQNPHHSHRRSSYNGHPNRRPNNNSNSNGSGNGNGNTMIDNNSKKHYRQNQNYGPSFYSNNNRNNNNSNNNSPISSPRSSPKNSPKYSPKYSPKHIPNNMNRDNNHNHNHHGGRRHSSYTSSRGERYNHNNTGKQNHYRGRNCAREVSSVQLNTYIRQRGWSLPDYDENNSVIVGGVVVERESETIRKRSLALLQTTLCRWAASIEIEKNNENKTKTIATTTAAATTTTTTTSIDDISNNDSRQRPRVTLITFGSYRLGAYRPDADVDLLALCPPSCTRDDFFTSLVTLMENEPSICDIHPIASAYTPVLKFTINSINFDMLFGRVYGDTNIDKLVQYQKQQQQQRMRIMSQPSPPDDVANDNAIDNDGASMSNSRGSCGELIKESTANDGTNNDDYSSINNEHEHEFPIEDSFLMGMDDSEVRSANGVRVTQYIMNCVPNPDRFRLVLCAVKEWASAHGIYSNVLGFLGGVNWAIMVACVCERYPYYCPSSLLRTFFQTYATWRWPNPVQLVAPSSAETTMTNAPAMIGGGMKPWDPQTNPRDARHVMPIITPVFPRMNSAYNVGISQQRRIQEELTRAAFTTQDEFNWKSLYNRSDFFNRYANFLQITIRAGNNPDEFTKWLRLCESRLRILVCALDCPGMSVWPFAQIMKRDYTPSDTATNNDSSSMKSSSGAVTKNNEQNDVLRLPEALFFIGLRFARNVESIDLKQHTSDFLINQINSWEGRKPGMDFMIQHVLQQDLPHDMINEYLSKGQSDTDLHQISVPSTLPFAKDTTTKMRPQPTTITTEVLSSGFRGSMNDGMMGGTRMVSSSNDVSFSKNNDSTNESLRQQQQKEGTKVLLDGIEIRSTPDSPMKNFVTLEGVPSPQANNKKGQTEQSDDVNNKINQEQLFNFLTGKTDDLPPCVGSNDEGTQSTESEDQSSTMSPIHKKQRNLPRSGTEDSEWEVSG